jgi:hypothetical protein
MEELHWLLSIAQKEARASGFGPRIESSDAEACTGGLETSSEGSASFPMTQRSRQMEYIDTVKRVHRCICQDVQAGNSQGAYQRVWQSGRSRTVTLLCGSTALAPFQLLCVSAKAVY